MEGLVQSQSESKVSPLIRILVSMECSIKSESKNPNS